MAIRIKKKRIQESRGDRILIGSFYVIAAIYALACLYPFILISIASFTKEAVLVREGYSLIPSQFSIDAYRVIFAGRTIPRAYGVTTFVTVIGTTLSMFFTAMAAYAIGGGKIRYGNAIAFVFYFTMLFNGGLVPTYILISRYLQLRDTLWVYILPSLVNPWNLFLLRNFFSAIPNSFRESASLDGANEWTIMTRIIMPLSLPAMATISLFYALFYWGLWIESILYIDNPDLYSLQYLIMSILRNIDSARLIAQQAAHTVPIPPSFTIRYATALLTIGPIIFLYPFLQRYFVSGLRVGGVKG